MRSRDQQPSPVFTYCQKQEEKKRKRTQLAGDLRPHTFKELAHARLAGFECIIIQVHFSCGHYNIKELRIL